VVGYDGKQMDSLETLAGRIKAHRFFCYALESLYQNSFR
jgi:hypothetical protein